MNYKLVSLWDNNDQRILKVDDNDSPEFTALYELGYKVVCGEKQIEKKPNLFTQYALIEIEAHEPFIQKFVSNKNIDLKKLENVLTQMEIFDKTTDSITLLNNPEGIDNVIEL
jgi:hypothetical protein